MEEVEIGVAMMPDRAPEDVVAVEKTASWPAALVEQTQGERRVREVELVVLHHWIGAGEPDRNPQMTGGRCSVRVTFAVLIRHHGRAESQESELLRKVTDEVGLDPPIRRQRD